MSDEILFADAILQALNNNNNKAKISELIEFTGFTEENVRKTVDYLARRKYIIRPVSITFIGDPNPIPDGEYRLSTKGKEIIVSGLSILEIIKSELQGSSPVLNQTSINGNQNQVAQSGNNSPIIQTQDNSKINVLKQLIENDKELDKPKKKKLFNLLEKFNALKESGENAYELIKQVGLIAVKYVPLFLSLLN